METYLKTPILLSISGFKIINKYSTFARHRRFPCEYFRGNWIIIVQMVLNDNLVFFQYGLNILCRTLHWLNVLAIEPWLSTNAWQRLLMISKRFQTVLVGMSVNSYVNITLSFWMLLNCTYQLKCDLATHSIYAVWDSWGNRMPSLCK